MCFVDSVPKAGKTSSGIPLVPLIAALAAVSISMQPTTAASRQPVTDGGRVELGPGWRYEPTHGSSTFGGSVRFSWQMDRRWALGLEIGGWLGSVDVERFDLDGAAAPDVDIWVGDFRLVFGAHLIQLGPAWFYAVGGGGYHLLGVTYDDRYHEGATQAFFAGVGAYVPLGDRAGIFIEERYTAFAHLPASVGSEIVDINLGGNVLWLGLVVFFEPEQRPGGAGR